MMQLLELLGSAFKDTHSFQYPFKLDSHDTFFFRTLCYEEIDKLVCFQELDNRSLVPENQKYI